MRIYSCDDHLDLGAVPPDVWTARLPADLVERGPRVVERDGRPVWVAEDRVLGPSGSSPAGALSAIVRAGIDDDGFRAGDPGRRLQDMDRDGIQASVIYGPAVFGLPLQDLGLKSACYRAYNDWAAGFNQYRPDRLCLLARVAGHDPAGAAAEVTRCAGIGHRGVILEVFGADVGDPAWDPMWSAAAEAGLPVSFHLSEGTSALRYRPASWRAPAFATVAPMQLDEPLVAMVFSGALERHPDLRLVLAEAGVGWLPWLVARMDHEWEVYRGKATDHDLATPPSEIFRRQVLATFEEEPLGGRLIPLLGAEQVMWASDYPHPDSTFPHSAQAIARALGDLPEVDVQRIVAGNCARLYGFPLADPPEG